jgi:fructose-1,6-bisphosphatase/inositol monophosphatase family enzyme/GNAT superfamily N-acetyltransferase
MHPAENRVRECISIRDAEENDASCIASLLGELGYDKDTAFARYHIRQSLASKGLTRILLAFHMGQPVGFMALHRFEVLPYPYAWLRVTAMCVTRSHRRLGVGRLMILEAERAAIQHGCAFIELTSDIRRKDAHWFYEALGFEEKRRRYMKPLISAGLQHQGLSKMEKNMKATTEFAAIPSPILAQECDDIIRTAKEAAAIGGQIQMTHFKKKRKNLCEHPRDVKMAVDVECENAIVSLIRSIFPDHRILTEETGDLGGNADYLWIIDPLDGTTNFFHGLPQFCCCVACCRLPGDAPIPTDSRSLLKYAFVGVVYAPVFDEFFLGVKGSGASLNGKPLFCGTDDILAESIVAMSFGKTQTGIDRMTRIANRLAHRARKVRSYGCAGLDIAMVASCRLGGLLYRGIHLWDVAAAGIILSEAGGCLDAGQQPDGTWNLLAALPGVRNELSEIAN